MMAALSLLCSLALVFTVWLLLPIFIFGPLGIYFGWKAYRQANARLPRPAPIKRLLALAPMLLAIATMVGMIAIVTVGYRA